MRGSRLCGKPVPKVGLEFKPLNLLPSQTSHWPEDTLMITCNLLHMNKLLTWLEDYSDSQEYTYFLLVCPPHLFKAL